MAMLHIHAYPGRPPEDIELLVGPGRRGGISRCVVRSLRDHAARRFMPDRRDVPSALAFSIRRAFKSSGVTRGIRSLMAAIIASLLPRLRGW